MSQTGKTIQTEFIFEEHEINDLMKFFTPNVEAEKTFMEGKILNYYQHLRIKRSCNLNTRFSIGLLRTNGREGYEILE